MNKFFQNLKMLEAKNYILKTADFNFGLNILDPTKIYNTPWFWATSN